MCVLFCFFVSVFILRSELSGTSGTEISSSHEPLQTQISSGDFSRFVPREDSVSCSIIPLQWPKYHVSSLRWWSRLGIVRRVMGHCSSRMVDGYHVDFWRNVFVGVRRSLNYPQLGAWLVPDWCLRNFLVALVWDTSVLSLSTWVPGDGHSFAMFISDTCSLLEDSLRHFSVHRGDHWTGPSMPTAAPSSFDIYRRATQYTR